MDQKQKKKIIIERIIIFLLALIVLGLLVYFLKDIVVPFIKLEIQNDTEGAKELLVSKGVLGALTVSVVEALQMVVIFIPAEFIQLSSGMSYPWWLALILCDLGVTLGASIIYFLVNVFRFQGNFNKRLKKIESYKKSMKSNSTPLFMYLLFIMPIIPFGAICYWASSKKISYPRYVFTCATGVIPSILTSIAMGTAVKEFIANALPLWLLIIIIVALAALLFTMLAFVLYKWGFKKSYGTPDSPLYGIYNLLGKLMGLNRRLHIDNKGLENVKGPYLLLANHHSYYDFWYASHLDYDTHYTFVVNRFYFKVPVLGKILKGLGAIPKKIFSPDLETIKGIIRAIKNGYPVMLFPEGRLSADGGPSPMHPGIVALAQKLKVPVVLVRISKAYFIKPKWRKKKAKGHIDVEIERIIAAEELESMSFVEAYHAIKDGISFSEFANPQITKSKHKAEGLENLLYRCPHCGGLFTNKTDHNTMICSNCGVRYEMAKDNTFVEGKYKNLEEYYQDMIKMEINQLDDINIDVEVDTKIFPNTKGKARFDEGIFHLDKNGVSYKSKMSDLQFAFKLSELEGIAYSTGLEFELYYENELYYFYPKENKEICTRISVIYDLLKEREAKENGQQI